MYINIYIHTHVYELPHIYMAGTIYTYIYEAAQKTPGVAGGCGKG